ncbi:DNA-processing protein DprA [Candidatus Sororendozoicomonas aggregata]|uniref:DNA-processing protein DprA n=1 Tax=Candidatus Sororendozoicomonas aggregata TaxID=3073239 RepID=UPI002ED3FE76
MQSTVNKPFELTCSWERLEPWIRLSMIPGLGSIRLQRLLSHFELPEQVLSASVKALAQGVPEKVARAIASQQKNQAINKRLAIIRGWLDASDAHHVLCPTSDAYPVRLKELPDPPAVLYVIGNPLHLSEPQVAMVGSRRPTPQGRRMAMEIAEKLARSGFVITSGMAMGIDGAAHQGALSCYGNTIAVLGTGVDKVYPRSHQKLYESILPQGAVVSEYPLGTSPQASNFPRRNRIISGLSLGVLVVEAALESGSLISARLAAEQGREVFAMPGSVLNPMAKGCHRLIREGAVLVESADDILVELRPEIQQLLLGGEKQSVVPDQCNDPVQQRILAAMGYDVITVDQLGALCSLSSSDLSVLLTDLELHGLVESVPGGYQRLS